MAYREPTSTIYLFKGCPCDTEYNNTLFFTSKSAQWTYFKSLPYIALSSQSYQRYDKGVLRIRKDATVNNAGTESLYEYNYMMFCNEGQFNPNGSPGNAMKMFYCFINKIEYVNENTTAIYYTIDVMQTYMFDYKLGYCMVDREHSITDYVGEHTVEEDIDIGELTVNDKWNYLFANDTGTVASSLVDVACIVYYVPNDKIIAGHTEDVNGYYTWQTEDLHTTDSRRTPVIAGVYNGCTYQVVPCHFATQNGRTVGSKNIDTLINTIIKDCKGSIVHISEIPLTMWNEFDFVNNTTPTYTVSHTQLNQFPNKQHNQTYIATNKKLLSYPYQRIVVSNNCGNNGEYKWEEFYKTTAQQQSATVMNCSFKIQCMPMTAIQTSCFPSNYRGIENDYENSVMLNDFPMPSWNEDSFATWWASNQNSYVVGILNGALTSAMMIGAGAMMYSSAGANLIGAEMATGQMKALGVMGAGAMSGIKTAASALGTYADRKNTPDTFKGQIANTTLRMVQNRMGYTFYSTTIDYEHAKIIDNFFTKYGYAVKTIKVPNIFDNYYIANNKLRPHWNYIKNIETVIIPYAENSTIRYLPEDAEHELKQIYNNGITFWMNGGEVGDYSLTNTPQ